MSDIARALRLCAPFRDAAEPWLIETSAPLRVRQAERLAELWRAPSWGEALSAVPRDAPLLLVANELLDCLPVRQFQRTARGWAERMVGLDEDGRLAFGLAPAAALALAADAPVGTVVERSPAQAAFAAELGARIAAQGGAALVIDYGAAEGGVGDTLQALRRHEKEGPLESPGEADLTAHVDFAAVLEAARSAGARAALISQGELLRRLGIEARAAALAAARPDRAAVISRQLHRLTHPDEMGELFKAAAIWAGPAPPAFEDA
jgi:SAM-dependent MidA family methyltransferase